MLTNNHVDSDDFHFWQVLADSEGMLFSTFITEIREALHEAMVSIAKRQGPASCFSKLLVYSISTYSLSKETLTI